MVYKENNLAELTRWGQQKLSGFTPSVNPDIELLLCDSVEKDRAWLFGHKEYVPSAVQSALFQQRVQRRRAGEPIAYILGRRAFWTLDLEVTPDTLVPRPETEILIEEALSFLQDGSELRVLDLGTGSGAIALALAQERPDCRITATDLCADTLTVARRNAETHQIRNVTFSQGSWYDNLAGQKYDLIVSNPPYVDADDPHLDSGDLRFEPRLALTPGEDGMTALRQIIFGANAHLRQAGCLIVEHGYQQSTAVDKLMASAGFRRRRLSVDLSGHDRVTTGFLEP